MQVSAAYKRPNWGTGRTKNHQESISHTLLHFLCSSKYMTEISGILQGYVKLAEFLGKTLGPDYEVVLHDLTDANHSIIAIENGHISGRKVGAQLTNMALSVLRDKSYEEKDYRVNDYGISSSGKALRSNTLFIKHDQKLIGMLCINFDDSRYKSMAENIMALAHPQDFREHILQQLIEPSPENEPERASSPHNVDTAEKYGHSSDAVALEAIKKELDRLGVSPDRLTAKERMQVIAELEKQGIFYLKGIVKDVAIGLQCSQASVYRYMSQLKIDGIV